MPAYVKRIFSHESLLTNLIRMIIYNSIFLGPIGNDGNACPASCPPACPADHMICGGAMDANGCQMPDTCAPITGYNY